MPLGNTNWAGNILAVTVNTQICNVKVRGWDGWSRGGSVQLPRLGRGRHLTREKHPPPASCFGFLNEVLGTAVYLGPGLQKSHS